MVFSFPLPYPTPVYAQAGNMGDAKQVGAFHKRNNAEELSEDIKRSGKQAFIVEKTVKGRKFYAVLEGESIKSATANARPAEELGYEQAGAFLTKENAETMIISLRQQGAITFHCMKKQGGKIYYKVYRKTGVVNKTPCTSLPAELPPGQSTVKQEDSQVPTPSSAQDGEPPTDMEASEGTATDIANAPSPENPEPAESAEGQDAESVSEESLPEAGMTNAVVEGQEETTIASAADLDEEEEVDINQPEATTEEQSIPLTGPVVPRPPLTEAPSDVVLDISPIVPIEDNDHFYLKSDAVVFTNRDQFSTWYGKFSEFGSGTVTGQSNKWYIVRFRDGITGYVRKEDSVQYTTPYEEEEDQ